MRLRNITPCGGAAVLELKWRLFETCVWPQKLDQVQGIVSRRVAKHNGIESNSKD